MADGSRKTVNLEAATADKLARFRILCLTTLQAEFDAGMRQLAPSNLTLSQAVDWACELADGRMKQRRSEANKVILERRRAKGSRQFAGE